MNATLQGLDLDRRKMDVFLQEQRPSANQLECVNQRSDTRSHGEEANVEMVEVPLAIREVVLQPLEDVCASDGTEYAAAQSNQLCSLQFGDCRSPSPDPLMRLLVYIILFSKLICLENAPRPCGLVDVVGNFEALKELQGSNASERASVRPLGSDHDSVLRAILTQKLARHKSRASLQVFALPPKMEPNGGTTPTSRGA